MSRSRSRVVRGALALAVLAAAFGAGRAAEMMTGDQVVFPEGRAVNEDVHAAGRTVRIAAPVYGDVAAAGQSVTLSGDVQGYVLAAGAEVEVGGRVGNDLWAAGRNVTVTAPVGDDAMLAGGTVTLAPSASVRRDLSAAGGAIEIRGPVSRNVRLAGSEARVASQVQGTVRAHVDRLTLLPGAQVTGDLVVYSPHRPIISPEAKVLGRVEYHPTGGSRRQWAPSLWTTLGWWLFRFLSLLGLGAVLLTLSALWTQSVAETLVRQTSLCALVGLLVLLLVPIAGVMLLITVVGLPLAVLLLALYSVVMLLASVFVAYLIGWALLRRWSRSEGTPFARLAWGALLLSALMALPWIGGLVRLVVLVLGAGALLIERRNLLVRLRAAGLA